MISNFCSFSTLFIFTYADPVFSIIQHKLSDITYCNARITSLLSTLKKFRTEDEYFIRLYSEVEKLPEVMPLSARRRKRKKDSEIQLTDNSSIKRLFCEILDLIITQIEIRFKDISSLHFLELVNFNKFDIYVRNFPEIPLKSLIDNYKNFFDKRINSNVNYKFCNRTMLSSAIQIS